MTDHISSKLDPRGVICAIYSGNERFSGATIAARIVVDVMRRNGWRVRDLHFPALERGEQRSLRHHLGFVGSLAKAWLAPLIVRWSRPAVYLNLGQTTLSMIRAGVPFVMLAAGNRSRRITITSTPWSISESAQLMAM